MNPLIWQKRLRPLLTPFSRVYRALAALRRREADGLMTNAMGQFDAPTARAISRCALTDGTPSRFATAACVNPPT